MHKKNESMLCKKYYMQGNIKTTWNILWLPKLEMNLLKSYSFIIIWFLKKIWSIPFYSHHYFQEQIY